MDKHRVIDVLIQCRKVLRKIRRMGNMIRISEGGTVTLDYQRQESTNYSPDVSSLAEAL